MFSEWTWIFFAPMSLKSLSASYFKSFETLNLYRPVVKKTKTWILIQLRTKKQLEGERKQVITRGTFSCQEDSFHIWVQQWFYPFQHQPRLQSSRLLGLHLVRMSHVAIQRDMIERNRLKILQYILETIVIVIWPENERIGFLSDNNIEFGKRPNLRSIRDSLKL